VWLNGGNRAAMAMFRFSITYLALLFAAVAVDQLVRT
jgi:heme O synthase-like polyprenyltransferase